MRRIIGAHFGEGYHEEHNDFANGICFPQLWGYLYISPSFEKVEVFRYPYPEYIFAPEDVSSLSTDLMVCQEHRRIETVAYA